MAPGNKRDGDAETPALATCLVASVDYQRVPVTYQEGRSVLALPEEWGQLVDTPRAGRARPALFCRLLRCLGNDSLP